MKSHWRVAYGVSQRIASIKQLSYVIFQRHLGDLKPLLSLGKLSLAPNATYCPQSCVKRRIDIHNTFFYKYDMTILRRMQLVCFVPNLIVSDEKYLCYMDKITYCCKLTSFSVRTLTLTIEFD